MKIFNWVISFFAPPPIIKKPRGGTNYEMAKRRVDHKKKDSKIV